MSQNKSAGSLEILTILALGDSYTIGESLPVEDNFPNQWAALLRREGIAVADPKIIARTGWTTDELLTAIEKEAINETYQVVTLLAGVNNQYRGRSAMEYEQEFEVLLRKAIAFCAQGKSGVVVLSIPDWGVTPYAAGRDRQAIATAIDTFNQVNQRLAASHGIHYIDITPATRRAATDPGLLAGDGLHPSGKAYTEWVHWLNDWFKTGFNDPNA